MEIRVLKYFLMVAREENITRAAGLLHVTQPTLSRQLMQLEEELGVKLFHRGKYHVTLTDDGMLLKRRAQEILDLVEKTEKEFSQDGGELAGEISFGCGETRNMTFLSRRLASFRELYPQVRYRVYSATAEEIKDRIEKGILDMGLLNEPVDIGKYEFVRMKEQEQWGILVRKDHPLAALSGVRPEDLAGVSLLLPWQEQVRNELSSWFGDSLEEADIAAHYNLILNAANMVENGVGVAFCFRMDVAYQNLKFIPLSPSLETGTVLAWKKNQVFSAAASAFIQFVKHSF